MSGEPPSVCTVTDRTARKTHTCCECRGVIVVGERYRNVKGIWNGKAATFKTCPDCQALRNEVEAQIPYADEYPAFGELGSECHETDESLGGRFDAIQAKRSQAQNGGAG